VLVAAGRAAGEGPPPLALLQHVATVAALDVERAEAERERRRRLGAELLAHALDGRLDPVSAAHVLDEHGFAADDPLAVLVVGEPDGDALGGLLDARLDDERIPHLLLGRDRELHLLVPHDDAVLAIVGEALPSALVAGVSEPLEGLTRVRDAVREAHLARANAVERARHEESPEPLAHYGRQGSYFLPTTVLEAEAVARHVLGTVLDYDREHGTALVETVEAFLARNRSWQRTAQGLHLHRQTLVYRVRRFEEISGRKLDDTADVAEVWLALRTLRTHGSTAASGDPAG
ncbi:PucR family transcriptional regulator, partial [Patulibacter sp. S7RM1-6]